MKAFTKGDIEILPRAVDESCPGFRIKGHKLRWVSGGVESRRGGRMWEVIKVSKLPKEVVEKLKCSRWMKDGEDTIRRRDLTLACATLEEVKEKQAENKRDQKANEAIFRGKHGVAGSSAAYSVGETENSSLSPKDFQ